MHCRTLIFGIGFLAFALSLGTFASCAQDEPQPPAPDYPPKPAGYSFPVLGKGQPSEELQPDTAPLTGVQNPTLGSPEMQHSYWVPGFQFSSNVFSDSYSGSGGSNWTANNYFIGNFSLLQAWSRDTLTLNYSGGGFLSTDSQQGNGWYQQLGFAQSYRTRRWLLQVFDQFSYLPQSAFGFGGGTNLGVPGVGGSLGTALPGLGAGFMSNQSIYGVGAFYSNTSALQATYTISPRGSLTLAGSYGIMSFLESGNYGTRSVSGSIGYNYTLSPNDTFGLVYIFSSNQFPSNPQAYGSNVVSVAYGRKVTGRLALKIFIGPQFSSYRIPIAGISQTTGLYANANVSYAFHRGSLSVGYNHGLSGGGGVLVGSIWDQANASFSHTLTRLWTGSVNFGYSRNSPVGGTTATASPVYNSWFMSSSVNRPITRNFNFGMAYTANIGNYRGPACAGSSCNASNLYNTATVNLQWHPRPLVLP